MNHIQVKKEKEIRRRLFTSSIKRITWHFHVVVVQWRQRNIQTYTSRFVVLPIRRTMQHRLTTTTSLLRPCSFDQNTKLRSRLIILKTPLIRTPRCYDQEFMVQWWSHQRGSAVLLFELSRCRGRRRRCRGILNSLITRGSHAVHIPVFHSKCGFSDRSLTD